MSTEEKVIKILKEAGANGLENAMSPKNLLLLASNEGLSDKEAEAAIVSLIDQDIVEYEMNDQTDVTHLWLL